MSPNIEKESKLTQSRLKYLLSYNSETGIFAWKNPPSNRVKVGDEAGAIHSRNKYICIRLDSSAHLAHRLAWLYTYGVWPQDQIDHIDGIRNNNCIANLCEVNSVENHKNTKLHGRNTSGNPGVSFYKKRAKWTASISVDGKRKHLGIFVDKGDAIQARKKAEIEYGYHANHGRTC